MKLARSGIAAVAALAAALLVWGLLGGDRDDVGPAIQVAATVVVAAATVVYADLTRELVDIQRRQLDSAERAVLRDRASETSDFILREIYDQLPSRLVSRPVTELGRPGDAAGELASLVELFNTTGNELANRLFSLPPECGVPVQDFGRLLLKTGRGYIGLTRAISHAQEEAGDDAFDWEEVHGKYYTRVKNVEGAPDLPEWQGLYDGSLLETVRDEALNVVSELRVLIEDGKPPSE